MQILPIFTPAKFCQIWSVCFTEYENDDAFRYLFKKKWTPSYIFEFIESNSNLFDDSFWVGTDLVELGLKIKNEIELFYNELLIVSNQKTNLERSLHSIFSILDTNTFVLHNRNRDFRKGKANVDLPIIRIYAIELEDGTIVITGGAFKITKSMETKVLKHEINKLKAVESYLREEGISDLNGLLNI